MQTIEERKTAECAQAAVLAEMSGTVGEWSKRKQKRQANKSKGKAKFKLGSYSR